MIIKTVTQVGDPVIRKKAKRVKDFESKETKQVIKNLIDSMRHHGLVGMAAPQIGEEMQIFVTEIRETIHRKTNKVSDIDGLRVFVNPKILSFSEKTVKGWEGCGSVAESGLFGKVERSESIFVEAHDDKGKKFNLEARGLLARVIQHEMDHLNGIVFIDRVDTKTCMSRNEYLKMQKKAELIGVVNKATI